MNLMLSLVKGISSSQRVCTVEADAKDFANNKKHATNGICGSVASLPVDDGRVELILFMASRSVMIVSIMKNRVNIKVLISVDVLTNSVN